MNPDYSNPISNPKGHNAFIHGDTNKQLEQKEATEVNKNPDTYIEKEGKMIPISLSTYRKNKKAINEAVRKKKLEIENMFRKKFGQ